MVRPSPSFDVHIVITNIFAKDTSVFLFVVYSARRRTRMRIHGVRSLLDTIVRDATGYFLLIFTVHILVILFEFFTPVSDRLVGLRSGSLIASWK